MKRHYADSHPPLLNPRDADFLLFEWLNVAELRDRPRYREHSVESFDSVLDLAADIAIKRFAPHFKTADTQQPFVNRDGTMTTLPEMKAALSAVGVAGLLAGEFDHDMTSHKNCKVRTAQSKVMNGFGSGGHSSKGPAARTAPANHT